MTTRDEAVPMRLARFLLVLSCLLAGVTLASAQTAPRRSFEALRAREQALTAQRTPPSLAQIRKLATSWEGFVRRYPVSGYADDALWAAAQLTEAVSLRTNASSDREKAAKYFRWLAREYPASDKVKPALARAATLDSTLRAEGHERAVAASRPASDSAPVAPERRVTATRGVLPPPPATDAATPSHARGLGTGGSPALSAETRPPAATATSSAPIARLREVRRTVLPELVRITLELEDEVVFTHERIEGPPRVYVDLRQATATPALQDRVLSFSDDVVRQVRVGRRQAQSTRVVLDLEGVSRYSVFTLYSPFRIVVDLERARGPRAVRPDVTAPTLVEQWAEAAAGTSDIAQPAPARSAPATPAGTDGAAPSPVGDAISLESAPPASLSVESSAAARAGAPSRARPTAEATEREPARNADPASARAGAAGTPAAPPVAPTANASGGFSLARQLGLGVSRVVIDPGHGGHDPGALGKRISEAELVLDVSLRLEKLLQKTGIDVVMTRRTDLFVPLEERTAIANRERADLFLSIHANASRNAKAHGVETYFLNFASNPEAEAVAARENSASGQSMHTLPDIVRAIALNNKLDESRDFARLVQDSMVKRLRTSNKTVRDLGVKQAPFVVLIGAGMPSVLAEIAFVTHPQEGQLLRTQAYRQHVAEALLEAVTRYMKSLKAVGTVASQDW